MSPVFKQRYESTLVAVLWIALYGRWAPEGLLGCVLAATFAGLLGGLAFFLRIWLPVIWIQSFFVAVAAVITQIAWIKIQLWPWWVLAALGLVLPQVENLRAEGAIKFFSGQCGLFLCFSLVFLFLRTLFEKTPFDFFGEHAAGIFLILGLIAFTIQTLKPPAQEEA